MTLLSRTALVAATLCTACHRAALQQQAAARSIRLVTTADTAPTYRTVVLRNAADGVEIPVLRMTDGRYNFALLSGAFLVSVDVSVTEHIPIRTARWIPADMPGEIVIRVRELIPCRSLDKVTAIWVSNNFDSDSAVVLTGSGDGQLRVVVPFKGGRHAAGEQSRQPPLGDHPHEHEPLVTGRHVVRPHNLKTQVAELPSLEKLCLRIQRERRPPRTPHRPPAGR